MSEDEKKVNFEKGKSTLNKFIRYSTLAFEMGAIIGIGTYAGYWIDKKFSFETPVFTIILSLFSVFSSLYLVIKQVKNDNKKN
ncbi:MAG: AtpZ/AtpI family protein [Bacteroidales bacterium]|jgi:F0F1-type ATP synthase assembly protein I|nr:AtpZ/AtpI family protein [Bacteroidales bacterium]